MIWIATPVTQVGKGHKRTRKMPASQLARSALGQADVSYTRR